MRIGIVEWVDSYSSNGWENKSELDSMYPSKCISIGIIREKEDYIYITQSQTDTSHIDHTMCIPRCSIKRIRYLRIK